MNFIACVLVAVALLVALSELPFGLEAGNVTNVDEMLDVYNDVRYQHNLTTVEVSRCAASLASNAPFVFEHARMNRLASTEAINRCARLYCADDGKVEYALFVTSHHDAQKTHLGRLLRSGKLNGTLDNATTQLGLTRVPWKSMGDPQNSRIWAVVFVRSKH
ncbi:hypothetical protein SYNPS1DRAFT_21194 [Syncephalis pseudoplumigaleata]|uniref:SCP domain-containing protein n=1 Tax=Syncephalis pseudoplumigaleata TaxID=1712513 RepID=A0A4P9Z464_9FUNG|nr:hypothetical protein SYNPS1DRAFT_21194 [Syncephalis pseudoplumigaleata]|eukprot:RKP27235.1 hypothetical protein SYNPS1DRAFT_21194 [Syncephalis pseudoplumigaleata]